jgi:hypothetical protein
MPPANRHESCGDVVAGHGLHNIVPNHHPSPSLANHSPAAATQ